MRARLTLCLAAVAFAASGCFSLKGRLLSADPAVRAEALQAAARAEAPERRALVAKIKKDLSSRDTDLRIYAAGALEDIGPEAADAAPELVKALFDKEPAVALSAERTLTKLPAAADYLAKLLASPKAELRDKAASILVNQGEGAAIPLAANFDSGNKSLAIESIVVLARMGPAAGKAVPALARAAVSSDAEIRALASSALSDIGKPAGLWLAEMLRSPNPRYRYGASKVLAGMLRPPPEALDNLAGAVWDEEERVRLNAAEALAAYAPSELSALPEDRVPGLVTAASGEDAVAPLAARALIKSGKVGQDWLGQELRARNPAVRREAAAAIARMDPPPPDTAPALLKALKDPDLEVRASAAGSLSRFSVNAAAAFPAGCARQLYAALDSSDGEVRLAVLTALGRRAHTDDQALSYLVSALSGSDMEIRTAAAGQLEALRGKAAAAEKPLWQAFGAGDCRLQVAAARALAAINPRFRKTPAVARAMRRLCPAPAAAKKEER
ncbi:MAG: HEAT repeat domain-containing protein [Elusimicrobia bacterium]|nr:HEAT repeat domain-containing protein [Elusimicrobiota bacterium]